MRRRADLRPPCRRCTARRRPSHNQDRSKTRPTKSAKARAGSSRAEPLRRLDIATIAQRHFECQRLVAAKDHQR